MGTIIKGILGGFSGTVGTVIGGTWKGIDYMRSKSSRRSGNFSAKQLEQQAKFGMMMKFLRTFGSLLSTTFQDFANGITGPNAALTYNISNAITGVYPAFSINYSLVMLSKGRLQNATAPAATAGTAGKLNFSWTDNSGSGMANATDQAILFVHCPATKQTVYNINAAARNAAAAEFNVTGFSGKTVQTWISFITDDGTEVSDSVFAGEVDVV